MILRTERPEDATQIRELTEIAFENMEYSDGSEGRLIGALRADGALTLSLVAEEGGAIIGHIAFSPVLIDGAPGQWFGLGPVSVRPDQQSQGIGSALIREGLARIAADGAEGCVLLGYPAYYSRFGFVSDPDLTYLGMVNPNFQRLTLKGEPPRGDVAFHPAFDSA